MKRIIISLAVCAVISALSTDVFAGFAELRARANFMDDYVEKTQLVSVQGGVPANYSLSVLARARPYPIGGAGSAQAYAVVITHDNTRYSLFCSSDDATNSRSKNGVSYGCSVADRNFTLYVEAMADNGCNATAVASLSW